jgi:glycosyltransferase involved in cell wall biosynthesis
MKRPRVLVVTTYYHPVLGGVETHARQLVQYLAADGFPVQVLTKRVSEAHPARDTVDGVPVHRVRPTGDRRGAGKWIALPSFYFKLQELGDQSDVIVCVDYRGIGIAAVLAGGALDVPVIVQAGTAGVLTGTPDAASGVPAEPAVVRAAKAPIRAIYRRADHFVCIARDIERETLAAGIPRERVHYIPHGVDRERFRPAAGDERARLRDELGWPRDRPVVLFVGRLSTEKGVLDLLEAWRLVAHTDARLVLVGPDMPAHPWDAGPQARAFVAAHGLADRVAFHGASDDPAPLYRAADVFVQPSHFEAFGISVIEAMASGLPVAASAVGGLLDFLRDGDNALLSPPKSPAALASALGRLLGDADLRGRIAAAGARTVAERFDAHRLFEEYGRLIEQVSEEH